MQLSISNHFSMMKAVITAPKTFYEGVSESEGYKKSIIFLLINTFLTMLVVSLFSLVFSFKPQQFLLGLTGIIVALPVMLGLFFVGTAILHVIAKVLGGKGKFVGSFQALSYASGVSPLTAIPVVGFLASFYQMYVTILGFRKIHQYSTVKAVINILLPVVLIMLLVLVAVAVTGFAAINLLKGTGLNPQDLKNLQNVQNLKDLEKVYPTFMPNNYPTGTDESGYPTDFKDYQETDYTE